ncbi:MAG: transcription-repair coupling factor [Gammaproteobacteria bacterium]|nr:transcription-repair coupling factor [Gammaproteobacteria bacterium]
MTISTSSQETSLLPTTLKGGASSLALAHIVHQSNRLVVAITKDMPGALRLEQECRFFLAEFPSLFIRVFPDWETLPYDRLSPHPDIISERLALLYRLQTEKRALVIIPLTTLLHVLPPPTYINLFTFILKKGDGFNPIRMREQLLKNGYFATEHVLAPGEFAQRGSIFDLFPMGSREPYRIDLVDNEVDSLRSFDIDTQRSTATIPHIEVLPARECPLTLPAIAHFKSAWRERFTGLPTQYPDYCSVIEHKPFPGIEYYLPLFFTRTAHFWDYVPPDTLFIFQEGCEEEAERFWSNIQKSYDNLKHDITRPILPPQELFLSLSDLQEAFQNFQKIRMGGNTENAKNGGQVHPTIWKRYLDSSYRVLFIAETEGRREMLLTLLKQHELSPSLFDSWKHFLDSNEKFGLVIGPLESGAILPELSIVILTETELLGEHVPQRRLRKRKAEANAVIMSLSELILGSPVVHIDHGIGRYVGLQTLSIDQIPYEFLVLEYRDFNKLYVPITDLHLIHRYIGENPEQVVLHQLGHDKWQKQKKEALARIQDTAADLLEITAKRAGQTGFGFVVPPEYAHFAASFPFEETPDQQTAIGQVITDMTSQKPMDRLVCGDVGFGKTEVALRAAFIAAYNHKQVALLTPTTLLATQHTETFQDRFANWPIRIASLSRFQTHKEQVSVLKALAEGQIDIVIGTHRLLQKDIQFHDCGLLIVDEEHRFGVRHKERIKSLKSNVDILTLTATPIPRTLHMTMASIRELSLITTPPLRRLSIKTFVRPYEASCVREAILREHYRGGQVYFLHNDVRSITRIRDELQALLPEAKIAIAHGQMRERALERIMSDFYHRRINVLVCTTIIESGIDVPTANTILIHRADKLGLTELHQLRGRVGRSHHQAYAYLFTSPDVPLARDAKKRLEAIAMFEELGTGFLLASHDMEIRGVGELLGEEQSGQIETIGYTLYQELLEKTVEWLKAGAGQESKVPTAEATEIHCPISALIPETLIPDVHTRLIEYKRLSYVKTETELEDLQAEFIDRFGKHPLPLQNLFRLTLLKLKASSLYIRKIDMSFCGGVLEFSKQCPLDSTRILELITQHPTEFKLKGPYSLKVIGEWANAQEILAALSHLLDRLCR